MTICWLIFLFRSVSLENHRAKKISIKSLVHELMTQESIAFNVIKVEIEFHLRDFFKLIKKLV